MQFGTLKMLMAQQLRAENDLQVARFPARVRILVRPCTRGESGGPTWGARGLRKLGVGAPLGEVS